MNDISVIIPVPYGEWPAAVLERLETAPLAPGSSLEVLVVEGSQPSRQRNEAAKQAQGKILYFLDDDSFVLPGTIEAGLAYIHRENTAAVSTTQA